MADRDGAAIYQAIVRKRAIVCIGSLIGLVLLVLADLMIGPSWIPIHDVVTTLFDGPNGETTSTAIVWSVRLPMTFTCIFVGASLGLAGVKVQTICNNPLASPYTLGLTSGAAFGAATAIFTGFSIAGILWLGTAVLAFIFAGGVSLAIYMVGKMKGMSTITIILAGIVMNFFFVALQQLLQYKASAEVAQLIASWTFGSLTRSSWTSVAVSGCILVVCAIFVTRYVWQLTALTTSEENAKSLGVDTESVRLKMFMSASLLTAGAVSFIGTVGFVGLVAPHCARLLVGEDQRYLIPASVIFGSLLMLAASITAKLIGGGSMIPVGIVTSLVGVPALFILLMKTRRWE
ncbi:MULTISPECIES: FecCD family ABC transporter permease [unclassified Methanoculleus]|jgi:iron complex transport system permease protein|uniref:FecCD family ABC transporter permease n=3 Tax=Methanoculleus TaxID=45989 RepID=UPI0025E46A4E|nr:iron ABC transporter permease [Methanoculleus sp. UBA377]MDD2474044.1 iron ABC transporter permease [Methanoculleus sp.]